MERVRVGVVGTGKMGEHHLEKYRTLPSVELVGIYEPNKKRADHIVEKYGVRAFESLTELYFEADAVSIASSTSTHFSNCKQALSAGVHVLVEKPMCDNVDEARELVALAEKNQLILQVGYLERFRLNQMAQFLHKGPKHFVDVHWLATSLPRESGIDVLGDMVVHPLDLILSLFNSTVINTHVRTFSVLTGVADMASIRLDFETGACANLWVSRVSGHRERRLYLFSDVEQATLNFLTNHIEIVRPINGVLEKTSATLTTEGSQGPDILAEQCQGFISAIQTHTPPLVSGVHGLQVLEVLAGIRKKAAQSKHWSQRTFKPELHDGL